MNKIYAHIGPMFAGKTSELHRLLKLAQISKKNVILFHPIIDTRLPVGEIPVNHDGIGSFNGPTFRVRDSSEILEIVAAEKPEVVGYDEGHFFDPRLLGAMYQLYQNGLQEIYAGLDTDFLGRPFETTRDLIILPEVKVFKWKAVCAICRCENARRTIKINSIGQVVTSQEMSARIEPGDKDKYKPVCFSCFTRALSSQLTPEELLALRVAA